RVDIPGTWPEGKSIERVENFLVFIHLRRGTGFFGFLISREHQGCIDQSGKKQQKERFAGSWHRAFQVASWSIGILTRNRRKVAGRDSKYTVTVEPTIHFRSQQINVRGGNSAGNLGIQERFSGFVVDPGPGARRRGQT